MKPFWLAADLALSGPDLAISAHTRACVHANTLVRIRASTYRVTLRDTGENSRGNSPTLVSAAITMADIPVLHRPLGLHMRVTRSSVHHPPGGQSALRFSNGYVANDGFDVIARVTSTALPPLSDDPNPNTELNPSSSSDGCSLVLRLPQSAAKPPHGHQAISAQRISLEFHGAGGG